MKRGVIFFLVLLIGVAYLFIKISQDVPVYGYYGGCENVDDVQTDKKGTVLIYRHRNHIDIERNANNDEDSWLSRVRDKIVDFTYQRHNKRHHHGELPEKHRITCE
ncbi:hypothetical protein [Staphylococcus rostri]|uniref:hypothetical protein n=1 Tax=Staphylococcus rostri TaxID=522262 RepID=UPI00115C27AA|nr:hypothetical protein [Staphylococcus rostri]